MGLKVLDTTEDRNFQEGETIYDVDGCMYSVRDGFAELDTFEHIRYDLSTEGMRNCFTRRAP